MTATAIPFSAIGKENGLPFCPVDVDVSALNFWITLGGYKKTDTDSVTQAQIDLSLRNAMRLWWNSHKISAPASAQRSLEYSDASNYPSSDTQSDSASINLADFGLVQPDQSVGSAVQPHNRTCVPNGFVQATAEEGRGANRFQREDASSIYRSVVEIVRMYNGSTSDDDNFVGYGFQRSGNADGFLRILAECAGSPRPGTSFSKYAPIVRMELKSYPDQFRAENDPTQTGSTSSPDSSGGVVETKLDRGYGTKDGFHFFVFVEAEAGGTTHNIDINISDCSATATSNYYEQFGPNNIYFYDYTADASVEFVSITDYTYA